MKPITKIAIIGVLITVIGLSIYILLSTAKVTDYSDAIITERAEKDIWLSNDFESPFAVTNTPFQRLKYYEPDQSFRIKAKLIKAVSSEEVTLITSTGENQVYSIYGTAIFELDGESCLLKLLQADGSEKLFLPYMDKTSGEETYGAGRYIDLEIPYKDEIIIDFNNSYNPYCAYTEAYSCPFPPKSNVLPVAIEAGEKTFKN